MAAADGIVQDMGALDPMLDWVRQHLSMHRGDESRRRAHQALRDFSRYYPTSFNHELLSRVNVAHLEALPAVESAAQRARVAFADVLSEHPFTSVFLLRDGFQLFQDHRVRGRKGLPALVNRTLLTGGDERKYFELVGLVYQAILRSVDFDGFRAVYLELLRRHLDRDALLRERSRLVAQYVRQRVRGHSLLWIDVGAQFTFALFCLGSLELHEPGEWTQDVFTLTAWPWMQDRFAGRYFSIESEHLQIWEQEARRAYAADRHDRIAGLMVGFAIGDALGAPAAGIENEQLRRVFPKGIRGHTAHSGHPLLGHLTRGQYTENSSLLALSARSLLSQGGFRPAAYASDLAQWAAGIARNGVKARWPGPTALEAANKLCHGVDWRHSGSRTSESCSCAYRTLPFGVVHQAIDAGERLVEHSDAAALMTHASLVSRTCAIVSALLVAELLRGTLPSEAMATVLGSCPRPEGTAMLFDRLQHACDMASNEDDAAARLRFGTGSQAVQTLPLSIFFLLRYASDFAGAVRAGANSWRVDSALDRTALAHLDPVNQMIACQGGNSDGIAALTGAFAGCAVGARGIPSELGDVEDREAFEHIASALADVGLIDRSDTRKH